MMPLHLPLATFLATSPVVLTDAQQFVQDFAVVMLTAGITAVVFHRLKLPIVLGYLLAGLLIGPHTPPFTMVKDPQMVEFLAEMGMVFFMFALGLHFSIRQLAKVGLTSFVAAAAEIMLMTWIGYSIGSFFGWSKMNSIFLGAMLSISSTTIVVKTLNELHRSSAPFAKYITGILVVEDLLGVTILTILSSIAMTGSVHAGDLLTTFGRLAIFLSAFLVTALIIVPALIRYVYRLHSNELMTIAVLGLSFGVSLLAVRLGYSAALGAFLIGAVIAETPEHKHIQTLIEPMRDVFGAIFFVSTGMLIAPDVLLQYAGPILLIACAVWIGKVLTVTFGAFVAGRKSRVSLQIGMSLAQIGEFSFIIAALGLSLHVMDDFLYPVAVAVTCITTLTTPFFIRLSDPLCDWLDRHVPGPILRLLRLYTWWLSRIRSSRSENREAIRTFLRANFYIGLSLALITAIFIAANALASLLNRLHTLTPPEMMLKDIALWCVAMVFSSPLLVMAHRRLRTASESLVAASGVDIVVHIKSGTTHIQGLIASILVIAGTVGMGLYIMVLSSALMPVDSGLYISLLMLAGMIALLSHSLWRLYARARNALVETLTRPIVDISPPETTPSPSPLSDVATLPVLIHSASPVCGKRLIDASLKTRTGAIIVAIERQGIRIINPGPNDILTENDSALLLGTEQQVEQGRRMLEGTDPAALISN